MKVLRRYQLDIIFLFFALITVVGLSFFALKYLGADPHNYEWIIAGPLILFYFLYLMKIRKLINIKDRRQITSKSLIYWIILGIGLFSGYSSPIGAKEYWSVNLLFLIFTLMLADSYWDFRTINIKKLTIYKKDLDKI